MVNISKRKLNDKIFSKIYDLLFTVISRMNEKESFSVFMNEFFTPKEKVLLAKRIAIIYLLTKNIEQYAIAEILKVSTTTVAKFSLLFSKDAHSEFIKLLRQLIKKEKLF